MDQEVEGLEEGVCNRGDPFFFFGGGLGVVFERCGWVGV